MIIFRYQVEVKCSEPKCKETLMTTAQLGAVDLGGPLTLMHVRVPKSSGWRRGRFVPGILHPARGGIPKKDEVYQEPGDVIACPAHGPPKKEEHEGQDEPDEVAIRRQDEGTKEG